MFKQPTEVLLENVTCYIQHENGICILTWILNCSKIRQTLFQINRFKMGMPSCDFFNLLFDSLGKNKTCNSVLPSWLIWLQLMKHLIPAKYQARKKEIKTYILVEISNKSYQLPLKMVHTQSSLNPPLMRHTSIVLIFSLVLRLLGCHCYCDIAK